MAFASHINCKQEILHIRHAPNLRPPQMYPPRLRVLGVVARPDSLRTPRVEPTAWNPHQPDTGRPERRMPRLLEQKTENRGHTPSHHVHHLISPPPRAGQLLSFVRRYRVFCNASTYIFPSFHSHKDILEGCH